MPVKAVILAAGTGARLCPLTPFIPKEMLPIGGFPAIHHVLVEVLSAGVNEVMIVLSDGKQQLRDYLTNEIRPKGEDALRLAREREKVLSRLKIKFALQEKPLGTAHAISLARSFAGDDPLLVVYPDDLLQVKGRFQSESLTEMIALYEKTVASVLLTACVPGSAASQYGVLTVRKEADRHFVTAIREKPQDYKKSTAQVMIGRMILTPWAMDRIPLHGYSDAEGIVPTLADAAEQGRLLACLHRGARYDLGSHQGYGSLLKDLSEQKR